MIKERILPERDKEGHDPFKVVPAYIRHLRAQKPGSEQFDIRIKQAKAELAELELAELKGEVVRIKDVDKRGFDKARRVRDAMLNIADRVSGIVAAEKNQEKVHGIITREIRIALEALGDNGTRKSRRIR